MHQRYHSFALSHQTRQSVEFLTNFIPCTLDIRYESSRWLLMPGHPLGARPSVITKLTTDNAGKVYIWSRVHSCAIANKTVTNYTPTNHNMWQIILQRIITWFMPFATKSLTLPIFYLTHCGSYFRACISNYIHIKLWHILINPCHDSNS